MLLKLVRLVRCHILHILRVLWNKIQYNLVNFSLEISSIFHNVCHMSKLPDIFFGLISQRKLLLIYTCCSFKGASINISMKFDK